MIWAAVRQQTWHILAPPQIDPGFCTMENGNQTPPPIICPIVGSPHGSGVFTVGLLRLNPTCHAPQPHLEKFNLIESDVLK